MEKKLLAGAICFALSSHAMAESYQFEGNANYSTTKYDSSTLDDDSIDFTSLSGVYYFSPVNTDNHPLQEAAFLEKNGAVSLSLLNSKYSYSYSYEGSFYSVENKSEDKYSAGIVALDTYLLDGWVYIGGVAAWDETKSTYKTTTTYPTSPNLNSSATDKGKNTDNTWNINLGLSPINGLLIWSEFEKDVDVSDSWNLNTKYVMEFSGSALNIQAGYGYNAFANFNTSTLYPTNIKVNFSSSENTKIKSAYVLSDYYFDQTLSLGLGVNHNDFTDNEAYMIRAKKFFTNSFSVQAAYIKDDDADNYSIGISMRF